MRLAVVSDIHGNVLALEAVLADLKAMGAERLWVLGDLCAYGSRPAECLRLVREWPGAEVIHGNTDRALVTGQRGGQRVADEAAFAGLAERLLRREQAYVWTLRRLSFTDYEYLAGLPGELEMNVPGYGWVLGYHGTPGNDEGILAPETPDHEVLDQFVDREGRVGLGGHTHRPMDRDLGPWRVINVGSVGLSRVDTCARYALLTFEAGEMQVDLRAVAYDFEAAAADVVQAEHPDQESLVRIIRGESAG